MIPILQGEGVVLRPFLNSDAADLAAGCDDPLTQRFLPLLPSPYTLTDAHWWINDGSRAALAGGGASYAIADPETDRLLGGVSVGRIHAGEGEIGYWVAPWARGRGVASAAVRRLSAHMFEQGLQRLVLRTDPENAASQRVAIAAGFTREGISRRRGQARDGGRYDQINWARLAGDPEGPTQRLLPDLPGGKLTDGVVTLRPLVAADVDDTFAMRSLDEVVASGVPPVKPEREKIVRMCARSQAGWLAGERADMTIRDAATGAYAGEIGLYYWESGTQQGMVGYSLMPQWRGRGFATRAVRLVAAWAFEHVGVARLIAGTNPENVGSQRVLERAGFEREGYQRSRLPGPDGTRIDDILYALLPER
jgi:RimJ/RimL family protein N-acetyltransferase